MPSPPPQHMVTIACSPSMRSSSCSAFVTRMAPVAAERMPDGDGAAVRVDALHVGLELPLPREHDRRERLVDLDDVDVRHRQIVVGEQLARRGDRPFEHQHRVTADEARLHDPARGVTPSSRALSRDMSSTAPAPSAICDEVPAVCTPSGRPVGFSAASASSVVSRRPSSRATRCVGSGRLAVVVEIGGLDGHDLRLVAPLRPRLGGAVLGRLPKTSHPSRVIPHLSAMRSAPSNWLVSSWCAQ